MVDGRLPPGSPGGTMSRSCPGERGGTWCPSESEKRGEWFREVSMVSWCVLVVCDTIIGLPN